MLCSFHCISLHPQPTSRPRSHLAFLWSCTPSFGMGYLGLAKATPSFDMGYLGLAKATPSFRMGYLGLAKASPSFGIGYLGLAKANGGLPFATQVCLGWSPFPHSILCSVVLCARSWDSISITPMVWKPPFSPKKPYTYRGPVSQDVAKHNSFMGSIISFLPCILCLYFPPSLLFSHSLNYPYLTPWAFFSPIIFPLWGRGIKRGCGGAQLPFRVKPAHQGSSGHSEPPVYFGDTALLVLYIKYYQTSIWQVSAHLCRHWLPSALSKTS